MATRIIRVFDDEILRKKCKEVKELTPRMQELIDDMFETMYSEYGVGLAAPQVGVLKRIVTMDIGDMPLVLINPEILEVEGEQTDMEGCLSFPGKIGKVTRPNYVKVKALDRELNEIILEGEGLFARAVLHECDHLDGEVYLDKVEGPLMNVSDLEDEDEE